MTMPSEPLPHLAQFAEVIATHAGTTFLDHPSVRSRLLLSTDKLPRSGKTLETLYAPFEHIQAGAELVIVGITPGATQAENALAAARRALRRGVTPEIAAREAKTAASFSGAMRANLVGMLEAAGVPGWLGISSAEAIFGEAADRVHFTSALRYPVFLDGKNYNGSGGQPPILGHSRLRAMIESALEEEARALPGAFWLPLWDVPEAALQHLIARGVLRADRVLAPMPHPAGGNGENIAWFRGTTKATAFSSRRASTGPLLLERRDRLKEFFAVQRSSIKT
jgi:hypothetical protein